MMMIIVSHAYLQQVEDSHMVDNDNDDDYDFSQNHKMLSHAHIPGKERTATGLALWEGRTHSVGHILDHWTQLGHFN